MGIQLLISGNAAPYHYEMGGNDIVFKEYLEPIFDKLDCSKTEFMLEGTQLIDFRNLLIQKLNILLDEYTLTRGTQFQQKILGQLYTLTKNREQHWIISTLGYLIDNADASISASQPLCFKYNNDEIQ